MKKTRYKYKIYDLLEELSAKDLTIAKKWLPQQLGVSRRTFDDWKYIPEDSEREIPLDKAYMLASFFKIEVSELFTTVPENLDLTFQKEKHAANSIENILKN